ncbi:hypothetical protein [Brevibacillus agri]
MTLEEWRALPQYHSARPDQVLQALSDPVYRPGYMGNMLDQTN